MGFGKQIKRCASLAEAVRSVGAASDETRAKVEAAAASTRSFRDVLKETKASKNQEALRGLLGNEATAGLLETYLVLLSINPSHPDLKRCRQVIRDWSTVDESFFTWVEKVFKEAYEAKRKMRGSRGNQRLDQGQLDDMVNELTGRA